jgi:(p)ppGpp synthase/HD superfamily hydrolase
MTRLVTNAEFFAKRAHEGQVRKYTGEPYINHPIEVMRIVQTVKHTQEMLCAALLHDVVEDCADKFGGRDATFRVIAERFGLEVMNLVCWLTDQSSPKDGNRARRKEIDRIHISNAPAAAQTVKLADLISNSESILARDRDFARTYIPEKRRLLQVLTKGDPALWLRADDICKAAAREGI